MCGSRSIQPAYTFQATGGGALNVLEAARQLNKKKLVKVYQASSSEMYGEVLETPQSEKTPFQPQSPYGFAKVFAFHQTVNYRKSYDMFAVNGILFNHESPRRGETFVTRKITWPRPHALNWDCRTNCTSAIWKQNATGATPRIMSKACGGC